MGFSDDVDLFSENRKNPKGISERKIRKENPKGKSERRKPETDLKAHERD